MCGTRQRQRRKPEQRAITTLTVLTSLTLPDKHCSATSIDHTTPTVGVPRNRPSHAAQAPLFLTPSPLFCSYFRKRKKNFVHEVDGSAHIYKGLPDDHRQVLLFSRPKVPGNYTQLSYPRSPPRTYSKTPFEQVERQIHLHEPRRGRGLRRRIFCCPAAAHRRSSPVQKRPRPSPKMSGSARGYQTAAGRRRRRRQ